jgi:hypothetical protein
LLTAASVNDCRAVERPLQTERSASDVDDNRTALYAPPTARFTELGMSVSLPIFIQLQKYNGRRRSSHLCQEATRGVRRANPLELLERNSGAQILNFALRGWRLP